MIIYLFIFFRILTDNINITKKRNRLNANIQSGAQRQVTASIPVADNIGFKNPYNIKFKMTENAKY